MSINKQDKNDDFFFFLEKKKTEMMMIVPLVTCKHFQNQLTM